MQHNLDDLARLVRLYGLVLAYSHHGAKLAFRYPGLPADVRRMLHNHRRGLAQLMKAGDVRLCPARDAHRKSYYYAGRGVVLCADCQRLDAHQMGLWAA